MIRRSLSILFWATFFFLLTAVVVGFGWIENWRQQAVSASIENDTLTGPRDQLVINFSRPIIENSLSGKIALDPAIPFQTEWQDFGKRLVLKPDSNWQVDTSFRLVIGQGRTSYFTRTPVFSFTVRFPDVPKLISVSPADGSKDVLLGVEDPIKVVFDRSVKEFYVDFQLEPPVEVVYQNNPEKTVFDILPKDPLLAGKKYQLSIRARFRSDSDDRYQSITMTTFTTLPPKPATVSRDYATRIEEARRFTRAKRMEGKYIDVNIAAQVMTLFENGRAVDAYMISSGKPGMDTPRGDFSIQNQALRPWSKKYSLYMPHWQAITPDGLYGIHELPEWPGGYKEGANHLGTPVSHGCIRLGVGSAKRVFEWSTLGTPVVIY